MALLQDFVATIKVKGLIRNNRYSIIFPGAVTGSLLGMYCDQFQMPGLNISTQPSLTYGETREMPYQRLYDNITLSFYVDGEMNVKKYFDSWMAQINNPTDRTIGYYNNYAKKIQVDIEDLESLTKYSMVLHECYPKTLGAIQLDYASREVMKLSVTFQYKYWEPISSLPANDLLYLNQDAAGITAESQSIFNGITSTAIGVLENYGATALQKALINL